MRTLSPRERKLVAIGIAVLVLAGFWLLIINPVLQGFTERSQRRDQLAQQLVQNERLIARTAMLRKAAEEQARHAELYALRAPNAEQAAELLKTRLSESVARAGGELRSADSVEAQPGWVRASVSGVLSYQQLLQLLGGLTNSTPYLVVDSLSVTADRAITTNRLELLDVRVEASIPFTPAKPR